MWLYLESLILKEFFSGILPEFDSVVDHICCKVLRTSLIIASLTEKPTMGLQSPSPFYSLAVLYQS